MNTSISTVLLFMSFLFISCGSYPFAERYIFNISNNEFIVKLQEFKENNPEFRVYQSNKDSVYEVKNTYYEYDGTSNIFTDTLTKNSVIYTCHFYFSDIKAAIHTVINLRGDTIPCVFELTGVTYSPNFGGWQTINNYKQISKEDNKMLKGKFETEILDKLGAKWRHKKWYE
jgi:hypothetical protein